MNDTAITLRDRWSPVLLVAVLFIAYLPSLSGGFLNWDDPWLIRDNPVLQRGDLGALKTIWLDLSRDTRLVLGAEYLPVRDTLMWLQARLYGLDPGRLRIAQLALYAGAVLLFRGALKRLLGGGMATETAAWLFALHPIHVESVAWLAGFKDVLALLFTGAALHVYAGESKHRAWAVPVLLLCAHFSKSMTVVAGGLLIACDMLAQRKPNVRVLTGAGVAALVALLLHLKVGGLVGMTTQPAGGTRWTAVMTMGEVLLRYAKLAAWPTGLSLVHDVEVKAEWDLLALAGWALLVGTGVWAVSRWRREQPLPLVSWLWFVVPLLPVSQILFPLQNVMADRYLFLSVMAVALPFAVVTEDMGRRGIGMSAAAALVFTVFTMHRANLFGDSEAVFAHATDATETSAMAPYQLGQAREAKGDDAGAIRAYRKVLERERGDAELARRATNNLAKLLARRGELQHAEKVLRRGTELWPDDPKIAGNLAEVVARIPGREAEARRLYDGLLRRFPDYEFGRQRYAERYGAGRGTGAASAGPPSSAAPPATGATGVAP